MASLSPEIKQAVIAVLRGERTVEAVCAERGIDRNTYDAWQSDYLAGKVPPASARVAGEVAGRVEIVRDRYGVPHVFATRARDLFFGFGFAVAQDRLWQMDYLRRRAHGTLAEVLGRSALPSDLRARTMGFARVAERELPLVSAEGREALEGYAAGVNAAIAACADELPVEFDVLGYRPAPWTPLDSLTIARASLWQFSGRIEGIVLAEAARRLLPPHLAERFLAIELGEETIIPGGHSAGSLVGEAPIATGELPQGSNQWAVGGARSASGSALLASDGHVPYSQPSERYEVHLSGAGYDVVGIASPGVPVVAVGRNRHVAWGSTNNVSSTRDLYVEELDPADPSRYREGAGFRPFELRAERIAVRGEPAVEHVVRSTVRGPVVNELIPSVDPAGDPPLSLRWVGFEPADSLTVSLDLMRAPSAAAFQATLERWPVSTSNAGFADDAGHVGYQMRGRVPIRGRVTRGYRRAGEPADEWQGVVPFARLPSEYDPARGWIASANNPPAARDFPAPLYGAYADGYRMRRIRTLLESRPRFTVEDMGAFQQDVYLQRAADVCPSLLRLLGRRPPRDELAPAALAALREWDYRFDLASVGGSIFQAFWLHWTRRVAAARFPERLRGLAVGACAFVAHELITAGNDGWYPSQDALEAEVAAALDDALRWLAERLGPDVAGWEWGRLHPVTFTHVLAAQYPGLGAVLDVGPFPCPGTTGALNQQGFAVGDRLATVSGPHYRFLADLGTSEALGTNTTGNSGHPASPHYADQTADWLAGRYHVLPLDRATIEKEAEGTTVVIPA